MSPRSSTSAVGDFEANKSKTFNVPVGDLFEAFVEAKVRRRWMDAEPKITTTHPNRSVRMVWEDGTAVNAWFTSRGAAKSTVQVQHRKLQSADELQKRKDFWQQRFTALGQVLTG